MDLSKKQNLRNRKVISELKTKTKILNTAKTEGADNAQDLFVELVGLVDKAHKKGIIHKNKANRKKAQLAKLMGA